MCIAHCTCSSHVWVNLEIVILNFSSQKELGGQNQPTPVLNAIHLISKATYKEEEILGGVSLIF